MRQAGFRCRRASLRGVGSGKARSGMARADDLSTEGFGPLCWVLESS